MPQKLTLTMPAFNGIAANSRATLNLPIGLTYEALMIEYAFTQSSGQTKYSTELDFIELMTLKADGRIIMESTGAQHLALLKYNRFPTPGSPANVGTANKDRFIIPFDRMGMKTRAGVEVTAIGTGAAQQPNAAQPGYNPVPLSTLTLELKLDSGIQAISLNALALQSGPQALGPIIKRRSFQFQQTGSSGEFEIANLPLGDQIDKIYIFDGSSGEGGTNLSKVTLKRDNFIAFERTPAQNSQFQKIRENRDPQNGLFVLDPTEFLNGSDTIVTNGVQDFRLILEVGSQFTPKLLVDYIGSVLGT